jgi:lactate permease
VGAEHRPIGDGRGSALLGNTNGTVDVLLAAGPVAAALLWLLALRRTALGAGAVGCLVALALIAARPTFGLPLERLPALGLRALGLTWVVAYVLLFGLLLYQLMAAGGAVARLGASLAALPGDRAARALLLALPIGAFVEAVSGFGVSIVVVAPLLVAVGFAPRRAALLGLFTQNAVPWGALAVGVVLSGQIAGLPAEAIGVGCALLSAPLFVYFALLLLWLAGGRPAVAANFGLALLVAASLAAGVLGATLAFGVELGMVVGAPPALLVGLAWLRYGRSTAPSASPLPLHPSPFSPCLARALAPYGLLVAILLVTRLVGPLREWLQTRAVLELPAAGLTLPLLYSPGFPLLVVCLATAPLLRLSPAAVVGAGRRTGRQWSRASAALLAFMLLAELMLQSGMTDRLASAAAAGLGSAYVLAAPALGALSGFLTGSNAGGAAMMLPFQLRVAETLGLSALALAATQNAAAASASLASPQRVVLAATVMGVPEAESELVRAAIAIELGALALITLAQLVWLGVTR